MLNDSFHRKEICPICNRAEKAEYWKVERPKGFYDDVEPCYRDNLNSFFLCKRCGYFSRAYDYTYNHDGISFKLGWLRSIRQALVLRKHCKEIEQLRLMDHTRFHR